MTDNPKFQTDSSVLGGDDGPENGTEAVFLRPRTTPPTLQEVLGHAFLCWAWHAEFGSWDAAVRAMARTPRGLERAGLIERQTRRSPGEEPIHGFAVTENGQALLALLAGDDKTGGNR